MAGLFLILYLIILCEGIIYFLWVIDAVFGGEDYSTSDAAITTIAEIIIFYGLEKSLLYDLGSCRGSFVFGIKKACPDLRVVGIDNSLLRTNFARLARLFHQSKIPVQFLRADVLSIDASKIGLAFVYLPRQVLVLVEAKLQKEMKEGSLLITYRVSLPHWLPEKVIPTDNNENNIYVYRR